MSACVHAHTRVLHAVRQRRDDHADMLLLQVRWQSVPKLLDQLHDSKSAAHTHARAPISTWMGCVLARVEGSDVRSRVRVDTVPRDLLKQRLEHAVDVALELHERRAQLDGDDADVLLVHILAHVDVGGLAHLDVAQQQVVDHALDLLVVRCKHTREHAGPW